jgi:hypothetical protein
MPQLQRRKESHGESHAISHKNCEYSERESSNCFLTVSGILITCSAMHVLLQIGSSKNLLRVRVRYSSFNHLIFCKYLTETRMSKIKRLRAYFGDNVFGLLVKRNYTVESLWENLIFALYIKIIFDHIPNSLPNLVLSNQRNNANNSGKFTLFCFVYSVFTSNTFLHHFVEGSVLICILFASSPPYHL